MAPPVTAGTHSPTANYTIHGFDLSVINPTRFTPAPRAISITVVTLAKSSSAIRGTTSKRLAIIAGYEAMPEGCVAGPARSPDHSSHSRIELAGFWYEYFSDAGRPIHRCGSPGINSRSSEMSCEAGYVRPRTEYA